MDENKCNESKKVKFRESGDVLARWSDGLFYLGTILKVDDINEKCLVQFEDNSQHWALFKDLQLGSSQSNEITCCLCEDGTSEFPNEIVMCDNCGQGFHQRCHNPTIDNAVLMPEVQWICRQCIFATTAKRGGAVKKGPNAQALQEMKQSLTYDLKSLTWDSHHKTNHQQCYCYCGGPGDWYRKMLQCCRCKQWFHEACIQCLEMPMLYGDRFYLFVCSVCNAGPEYIKRLALKWIDLAHLILFNLTIQHNKKYYDFETAFLPFANDNWDMLQLGKLASTNKDKRQENLLAVLLSCGTRFKSGKEIKKKTTLWGLRMRVPPPAPTVILPAIGPITDEVMNDLQMKGRKTKIFVPVQSMPPIPLNYKRKKKSSESDTESIVKKTNHARKLLEEATTQNLEIECHSSNQNYIGFNGKTPTLCNIYNSSSDDDTSSQCTLDSIIPRLMNFNGLNNPFKNFSECSTHTTFEINQSNLPTSPSSIEIYQNNLPKKASKTTHLEKLTSNDGFLKKRRSRRRKNGKLDNVLKLGSENIVALRHRHSDIMDKMAMDCVVNSAISLKDLKSSVSYFGKSSHADGEKYKVLARRISPDGKVQYLIEWDRLSV